jgi:RHS repeat-associated protein
LRYADATFARTNVTLLDGTNTFTAVAQDNFGRADTNTTTAYLPATVTFAYDGNGNMTTNGTRVFEYDDENQLIRITEPNAWKSEFTYDGKMRRRIRKEYTWQPSITNWVQTNEVRYVYDGKIVIQERDGFNLASVTYTRGHDLSGTLEGAGGIGGLLARTDNWKLITGSSDSHAYYQADGNGNVTVLIGTNQLLVARYVFDPFGRTVGSVGSLSDANHYRFSSKEIDLNGGCIYYLHRFYEPVLQRWINRDPTYENGDNNLYRFLANEPLDNIDPYGLALVPHLLHRADLDDPVLQPKDRTAKGAAKDQGP